MSRKSRPKSLDNFTGHIDVGADYTPEQIEFMNSMLRLRQRLHRYPNMQEVLAEAIRVGYRKVAEETPLASNRNRRVIS